MEPATLSSIKDLLTVGTAAGSGILALFKYLQYKTRHDKMLNVRDAFSHVITSLASASEVERMAGAVLLRRFYDSGTEMGVAGAPYWKEAASVAAAILRGERPGNFQKLLGDGLAFAPTLRGADLQRTNLHNVYLGSRSSPSDARKQKIVDLSHADFYRADLSNASLKGAVARGAIFYQARLHRAVLARTDLSSANFFEADVDGASFEGALLTGATFLGTRNLPEAIRLNLNEQRVYVDEAPFHAAPRRVEAEPRGTACVFFSKPGCLSLAQQQAVSALRTQLIEEGFAVASLDRDDYPGTGAIAEIRRIIAGCAGAVIFGFEQLDVSNGVWRSGTAEEASVRDISLPTPWNHLEAGIALSYGLPVLILSQRRVEGSGGIFTPDSDEPRVYRALLDDAGVAQRFPSPLLAWCSDVRERAHSEGPRQPAA